MTSRSCVQGTLGLKVSCMYVPETVMKKIIACSLIALLLTGCFPSRSVKYSERGVPDDVTALSAVSKIHFDDGSLVIMRKGFKLETDRIVGVGTRYSLNGSITDQGVQSIPLDSIAAMTYHQDDHNAGEVLGSAIFGTWGPVISFLGLYCVSCPKCCFGCCPTVYLREGTTSSLRAECFSYCISPFTQRGDLDLLARNWDSGDTLAIRIANEALEKHYINRLELLSVTHPEGSRAYPTDDGRILVVSGEQPPARVYNCRHQNVTRSVAAQDDHSYRSSREIFSEQAADARPDYLAFELPGMPGRDSVTVSLRLRNTLLTTVLFYDLVLASQGVRAVEWTQRMAEDRVYATLFSMLYERYSGIRCYSGPAGALEETATIGDIGPIAWKEIAFRIPASAAPQSVRLEFFPDNVMIDRIAWSAESVTGADVRVQRLDPVSVTDYAQRDARSSMALVAETDDSYLVHQPGDNFDLRFTVDSSTPGTHTSILLAATGYYYEWVRGNWIRSAGAGKALSILDHDRILRELRERWLQSRYDVQASFFSNRIPLKEVTP